MQHPEHRKKRNLLAAAKKFGGHRKEWADFASSEITLPNTQAVAALRSSHLSIDSDSLLNFHS